LIIAPYRKSLMYLKPGFVEGATIKTG